MTYTYGQSPAAQAHARLQQAQTNADNLAAQILEAQNTKTRARLEELTRTPRINPYPIDPDWYEHRRTLNYELHAWAQRKAA